MEPHVDEDGEMRENSVERELIPYGGAILEPYVGMEFESADAAKSFYNAYAKRVGFIMRVNSKRRSKRDRSVIALELVCNKEGFRVKKDDGRIRRPRRSTREGCKATVTVKKQNSGKYLVTKFVKDHSHPLVISSDRVRLGFLRYQTADEKDKKIEELTYEVKRLKRRYSACRERLFTVLKEIEEHKQQLSKKIEAVEYSIREIDRK